MRSQLPAPSAAKESWLSPYPSWASRVSRGTAGSPAGIAWKTLRLGGNEEGDW